MSSAGAAHRVLVIDDSRAVHDDFRKIFGLGAATEDPALVAAEAALFDEEPRPVARPRFELESAFDGPQALAMVRRALAEDRPYAMAFVDVRMPPGLDGIETTAQIWQHDHDIQIVICTAHSDYGLNELLGKLGRSDRLVILKKPFDNIEIQQLAHTLTEKAQRLKAARRQLIHLEELVTRRNEQLAATRAQIHSLLASTGAVSWVMSLDTGACTQVTGPVESRWGWSASRFAEPGFLLGCLHPDDRGKFRTALERLSTEDAMDLDCRVLRSHGPPLPLRVLMRGSREEGMGLAVHGICVEPPRGRKPASKRRGPRWTDAGERPAPNHPQAPSRRRRNVSARARWIRKRALPALRRAT